jgi:hypothetical protein
MIALLPRAAMGIADKLAIGNLKIPKGAGTAAEQMGSAHLSC